jgi:gliding motility-associated lipoprotein GldH
MKHLFPLLLTAILFCSCGQKVLLDEESTFVNNKWMRFDEPVQFSFNNDNTEDFYNFIFSVSIDTNRYHQNGLPITVELCSPNGEVRTMFSDIVLRNYQGNWLGEFDEHGILHVSQQIRQYYAFNAVGEYSIKLSQRTNKYEIEGINGIHLKIEEAIIDYPE